MAESSLRLYHGSDLTCEVEAKMRRIMEKYFFLLLVINLIVCFCENEESADCASVES